MRFYAQMTKQQLVEGQKFETTHESNSQMCSLVGSPLPFREPGFQTSSGSLPVNTVARVRQNYQPIAGANFQCWYCARQHCFLAQCFCLFHMITNHGSSGLLVSWFGWIDPRLRFCPRQPHGARERSASQQAQLCRRSAPAIAIVVGCLSM